LILIKIKRFEHVGAAGVQQPRHLRLIAIAAEVGLHRIGHRGHLA
jgi:hypothetical protein